MTLEELTAWLKERGEPAFRAKQIFHWLYRGVTSFDEMTDLSKALREKLSQEDLPQDTELPVAEFLGWFDEQGQEADPQEEPVTKDLTYTARWARNAQELLNTDEHKAYANGYPNGPLKPQSTITRSEAAQLFYNLLRSQEWEGSSFVDVPES